MDAPSLQKGFSHITKKCFNQNVIQLAITTITYPTNADTTHNHRALNNWGHGRQRWVNHTLMEPIMMWSPCVLVTHQLLEQVCQGSWASSSGSAERLQQTGPSLGVHPERRGGVVQSRWPLKGAGGGLRGEKKIKLSVSKDPGSAVYCRSSSLLAVSSGRGETENRLLPKCLL